MPRFGNPKGFREGIRLVVPSPQRVNGGEPKDRERNNLDIITEIGFRDDSKQKDRLLAMVSLSKTHRHERTDQASVVESLDLHFGRKMVHVRERSCALTC
jgi:hypothetical protein